MEISPTETVARRLNLLAAIVVERAFHPDRSEVNRLVGLLREAAATAAVAPLEGGRRLPARTLCALEQARELMFSADVHLSATVLEYVVAPALGGTPDMKILGAKGEGLARKDFELHKRRNTVLHHPHLDSDDDEIVAWALRCLAQIHYSHERLAEAVAEDNRRPANRAKAPFHLVARTQAATAAAAKAGPREGDSLIAALKAFDLPAWLVSNGGISYVLVGVDATSDEGTARTGPQVLLYSGESADRPAGEHDLPWTAALYNGGEFDILFTAQAGLPLKRESAHAALCLASWLFAHAAKHPRL